MNQNVATRFLCATAVCVLSFTTVAQPIHIAGWNVAPSNGSAVFLVTNTVPTTRYALQTSSSLNGWNDSQYRLAHGNYLAMTASFSSASPKMFFRVAQSPFLTEGIEGQWRVFMLTAADDPGDYAGWFTSIMSFTSAGAGTWSSVQRSNGDTSSPPGVTFAVAPDGSISGGPPGSTWLMSLDKNTITFVMDDGGGGVNLGLLCRRASSGFTTSDLEGQWRVFMLTATDDPGDYAGWFTSIMSFTSAGAGTWSSVQRSNGDTSSPPGVTFAVAPDGSISGGPPGSTWLMSLDKNTITFVMDDGGGGVNLGVMTRN